MRTQEPKYMKSNDWDSHLPQWLPRRHPHSNEQACPLPPMPISTGQRQECGVSQSYSAQWYSHVKAPFSSTAWHKDLALRLLTISVSPLMRHKSDFFFFYIGNLSFGSYWFPESCRSLKCWHIFFYHLKNSCLLTSLPVFSDKCKALKCQLPLECSHFTLGNLLFFVYLWQGYSIYFPGNMCQITPTWITIVSVCIYMYTMVIYMIILWPLYDQYLN